MTSSSAAARVGGSARAASLAVLLLTIIGSAGAALAEDAAVLLRMLHDGRDFRVRTQAAFALGRLHEPRYLDALETALHDKHPVVRAAAATALGELGSAQALPALQLALRDPVESVVTQAGFAVDKLQVAAVARAKAAGGPGVALSTRIPAGTRYALVLGDMHNQSGFAGDELSQGLRAQLAQALAQWRGVFVLQPGDSAGLALARKQGLPFFRLEGNVTQIARERLGGQVSVHCELSILLLDEPGRTLRSVLKGAATGLEAPMGPLSPQERRIALKAVGGAVRSALHDASSMIENAAARANVVQSERATAALHRR